MNPDTGKTTRQYKKRKKVPRLLHIEKLPWRQKCDGRGAEALLGNVA